jgi:hypothetical protein
MVEIPQIFHARKPRKKIAQRQLELRNRLWPNHTDGHIWRRQHHHGFTTIPRTMPLILSIMDDLAGTPVGMAYLELWGRAFDDGFITLSKPREIAFHAGFDGQRGERTWRSKMKLLAELGFIEIQGGPSGAMSYALILNPYLVIRRLHCQNGLDCEKTSITPSSNELGRLVRKISTFLILGHLSLLSRQSKS